MKETLSHSIKTNSVVFELFHVNNKNATIKYLLFIYVYDVDDFNRDLMRTLQLNPKGKECRLFCFIFTCLFIYISVYFFTLNI